MFHLLFVGVHNSRNLHASQFRRLDVASAAVRKGNRDMSLDALDLEIKAFDLAPPRPQSSDKPVVVFYDGKAQEWFKSANDAYLWAKDRFPANSYLIRDVQEETPFLPLLAR
jgi:hypothetical protein